MNPSRAPRGHVAACVSFVLSLVVSATVFLGLERVWTLGIPVAISGLPILISSQAYRPRLAAIRWVSATLLVGWVILASMSVGIFYAPSAIAMFISALRTPGHDRAEFK